MRKAALTRPRTAAGREGLRRTAMAVADWRRRTTEAIELNDERRLRSSRQGKGHGTLGGDVVVRLCRTTAAAGASALWLCACADANAI